MNSQIVIVMPCLNEEASMVEACNSLGFGLGELCYNLSAFLIIVDNNSTDSTRKVAQEIQNSSPPNHVFIIFEKEKGFIPARKSGNQHAIFVCGEIGINISNVVILQVDADTIYPYFYVESMKAAAEKYGKNFLVEACVDYTPEFRHENNNYIDLLEKTDAHYEKLFLKLQDYIVDDKVVAYWLSDYIKWGGHTREYTSNGNEIFAETTRLFLKGQITGAEKRNIGSIKAYHSERKIVENPSMHFATAGFPRESGWEILWMENNDAVNLQNVDVVSFSEPVFARILHIIGLFYILPIHVGRTLNGNKDMQGDNLTQFFLSLIPNRSKKEMQNTPGVFLTDVFAAIDNNPTVIKYEIDNYLRDLIK
ncbi:glycosyltransferase family 2 protein [Pedobacter sp. P26]|uniref:glycosyltransferase family 2 protein n=1 Tax=Pedobacter sp. P26 TaxID=3423956 RepID=UPI003D66C940